MTSNDLKDFMTKHQLTTYDMSVITGKQLRTVQLWLAGRPIPWLVSLMVKAVNENKLSLDWIAEQIEA